jgi:hypothetical protein
MEGRVNQAHEVLSIYANEDPCEANKDPHSLAFGYSNIIYIVVYHKYEERTSYGNRVN